MLALVDQLAQRSMHQSISRSRSQSPGSAISADEPIELAHYPDAKVRTGVWRTLPGRQGEDRGVGGGHYPDAKVRTGVWGHYPDP